MEEFFAEIRQGRIDVVRAMLDKNPDLIKLKDQRGSTPLILAAYYDQAGIVDLLLQRGAEVDEKDASGNTALMGVCFKGFDEVARKLIDAGADVDARNAMGANCLIFAITFNRQSMAKLLISSGADLKAKDARGYTALDHARMQGLKPLVAILESRN